MEPVVITRIPAKPAYVLVGAAYTPTAGVTWDPDLSIVRVENDKVMGVVCGVLPAPQAEPRATHYFKLVSAAFIDEIEAQGRHKISVDVLDEAGRRLDGARVYHGWPTNMLPEFDGRIVGTVFGSELANWDLYSNFDAWTTSGPYWVQVADGASELFFGAGLPWKRHVCFTVVFQRTPYDAAPPAVTTDLDYARQVALTLAGRVDLSPAQVADRALAIAGLLTGQG